MGRYNNRRTQAAAAALKNTPSRARFSKGPPQKSTRPKRNNDNNDNNNAANHTKRGPPAATAARVIDKLQHRQQNQQQQQAPTTTATTEESLQYLDKSKLDYLKVPPDILDNIAALLERLGVVNTTTTTSTTATKEDADPSSSSKAKRISDNDNNEQEDDNPSNLSASAMPFVMGQQPPAAVTTATTVTGSGYTEYDLDVDDQDEEMDNGDDNDYNEDDDEFDDDYYYGNNDIVVEENDWEGSASMDAEDDENDGSDSQDDEEDEEEDFQDHPAFIHLTQQLSFSPTDAKRACRAIQDWDAVVVDGADTPSTINSKDNKILSSSLSNKKETIALAMDWLCLHLTEAQLSNGFRPNPNPPTTKSKLLVLSNNQRIIKAIPHPSISLATDIISDKAWARSVRIQERILKFVRLGFSHEEANQACEETFSKDDSVDMSLTKLPPLQDPALPVLLSMLRSKLSSGDNDAMSNPADTSALNATDLEFAAEERQHEREALEAIYDDQLVVTTDESTGLNKYVLQIMPSEELKEPARSEDCQLHVFLRRGYPVVETPLFWFTNSSLPPTLLRQINEFAAKQALENVGAPVIFEVVNALSEALPEMQLSFIRAQSRKEFDAEQVRMRKQAGHHMVQQVIDNQYEAEGKIGRRQRAKLRAAEKAFDRGDQQRQREEERRKRQEERVQKAQEESTRVRMAYAEQALLKRDQERIQEEAEQVARLAMNAAFNRGESAEEARAAAERARRRCLEEHGAVAVEEIGEEVEQKNASSNTPSERNNSDATKTNDTAPTAKTASFMERLRATANEVGVANEDDDTTKEESPTATNSTNFADATPTTAAFMERLRDMYNSAAKKKAGYHLADPKENSKDDSSNPLHTPRPVAVATGEMEEVMTDIIKQQEEQPWLISPEARVPAIEDPVWDESLSPEQQRRQREISKQLRQELERKHKLASEWAKLHGNDGESRNQSQRKNSMSVGEKYHTMLSVRKRLPAFKMAKEVVETIEANQVTVIAGDTGCGKTTQVPQLVLDDRILKGQGAVTNIIVTQPRRISAIGVSERISDERTERVGETCGYSIKLEKKMTSKTRLLLCTTGVLLRRLQCDPDLASVSHIFVDEVHERDLNTDFLIIILKDLLARRKTLKLVLMSATLNSEAFSSYFGGCPMVSIPGRAHPVKENRLEDILELTGYQVQEDSDYAVKRDDSKPPKVSKSALRKLYYPKYSKETIHSLSIVDETVINYELVAALLEHISLKEDDGAILVFMPGMMEITKTIEEMYKKEFFQSDKVRIYPLHSSLSTAEQIAIFEIPPPGIRKVVVSTNIAETSITIEDVVYVVDTGRVKENRRDEINETPTLVECWVSRASAKQRRGRAGRVRPGIAYHLYSTHTHDSDLTDYQLPEMLRVGIEDLVLQVLVLDLGEPSTFLGKALNPPSDLAMSNSLKLLETLGAVECKWTTPLSRQQQRADSSDQTYGELKVTSELTALGFHLATLPVDPRVGKLMIYGSLLGCVDPALTIAASMSSRSPFVSPFDQRDAADEARKSFAVEGSDHLTILNAFGQWKELKNSKKGNRVVNSFLKENFLGRLTLHQMDDLRSQFAKLLKDIGFLPSSFQVKNINDTGANANAKNMGLVKAVLCAGLYPNILVAPRPLVSTPGVAKKKGDKKVGECAFQSHRKGEVYLHPSTIAFDQSELDSRYCCYHEIVKTSKIYARDTTTVSPFALLLFGGTLKVYQTHGVCSVDDWLKFRLDAKPATLIKYLRGQMERILLQKIVNPKDEVVESAEGRALIESISILFASKETHSAPEPDRSGGEIVRPWTGSDDADNSQNRNNTRNGRGGGRGGGRGRGRRGGRGRGGGR